MIVNKKNSIHRARPSGKTVCATLAAAGLLSLAAAVTPAFAQSSPLATIIGDGDYYNSTWTTGSVNIQQRYPDDSGILTNITAFFVNNLAITNGDLNLASIWYEDTSSSPPEVYGGRVTLILQGNTSVSGDLNHTGSTSTAAYVTLDGTNKAMLTLDGSINSNSQNFDNITVADNKFTLAINGNINNTLTYSAPDDALNNLQIGVGTTGLGQARVSSVGGAGSITTFDPDAGGNLNFGGSYGNPTIIVGNNDFTVITKNGNITYNERLVGNETPDSAGLKDGNVHFTGDGNFAIIAKGSGANGNIHFANGANLIRNTAATAGDITLSADGNITSDRGGIILSTDGTNATIKAGGKIGDLAGSVSVNTTGANGKAIIESLSDASGNANLADNAIYSNNHIIATATAVAGFNSEATIDAKNGSIRAANDITATITGAGTGSATISAHDSITSDAGDIIAQALGAGNDATIKAIAGSITTGYADGSLTASATETGKVLISAKTTIDAGKNGLSLTSAEGLISMAAGSDISIAGVANITTKAANNTATKESATVIGSTEGDIYFGAGFNYTNNYDGLDQGDLLVSAVMGKVTFIGAVKTDFNNVTTGGGDFITIGQTIIYASTVDHKGGAYMDQALELGVGKIEYDGNVTLSTGAYEVRIHSDQEIHANASSAFEITQSGIGQTNIISNASFVQFDSNFERDAATGDLYIKAGGGKGITFTRTFDNDSTTGAATFYAATGSILHEDTVSNIGGQFTALAEANNQTITYDKYLKITVNDGSDPQSGAYIKTTSKDSDPLAPGTITFNAKDTSGDGFEFKSLIANAADVGDLVIAATTDGVEPPNVNKPGVTGSGNIIFHDDATISFVSGGTLVGDNRTGSTFIVTSQGQIEFNKSDQSSLIGFNYTSGGGDLKIISASAGLDGGNIIFHGNAEAKFTDTTNNSLTGDTLLHAYEGNVYTFGAYNHIGGTGDRSVASFSAPPSLARLEIPYDGNIRETDFTFTAGGGSALWAADKKIDLNVSRDGTTIGHYGPGTGVEFDFYDGGVNHTGGVAMVAGGAITVYNSLTYISANGVDGLAGSNVSPQLAAIARLGGGASIDAGIAASGITDEAKKVEYGKKVLSDLAEQYVIPKHMVDYLLANPGNAFWDVTAASWTNPATDSFQKRLENFLQTEQLGDNGLYLFSHEKLYLGKDFDLQFNGTGTDKQEGYVQAPSIVTRGKTTFDTFGVGLASAEKDLTVYTDQWNMMGGLTVNGDNLTVGSVTYDQTAAIDRDGNTVTNANGDPLDVNGRLLRGNPLLTLQGRIDLYDPSTENWAPNLFDRFAAYDDQVLVPGFSWAPTSANLEPDNASLGTDPIYTNDKPNNITTFENNVTTDQLGIFKNVVSAASSNSFTDSTTNGAFIRADVLTSLGVEVFTGYDDGTNTGTGQIHMVSGANLENVAIGAEAGLYASRWNLGETTYEQAAISDSTLKKIFDSTEVWVDELDNTGNRTPDASSPSGYKGNYVYGDNAITIDAGQPGAHADHKKFIGLGSEGNASYNYIRDGLLMEGGVDDLGFYKFGGTDSGVISYQALRSKIIFDQAKASSSTVLTNNSTTSMNLGKTDFYGWMNVRDARTVMGAAMYNYDEHNLQGDTYAFNQSIHYSTLGYGVNKTGNDTKDTSINIDGGIVWLETTNDLALSAIDGLQNLAADAYNPFPDSPFFNLQIGYLNNDPTKFGLIDFSRKMVNSTTPATLSNQAPSSHAGMAWVIEENDVFGSLHVPAYAYFNQNDTEAPMNNVAVSYDPATGELLEFGSDTVADEAYIQEYIKFVELDDYQFQHDNGYAYEYDRHHSVENILYLSPTRAQYVRDLTQISSAGNLDAVRMVNFQSMNNVFKMLAHRAAQRGWGLSASADCSPGSGLWGVADYRRTEVDGNFNKGYAGFDIDRYGATIGWDHQVIDERLLMGGYFSYSRPELDGWGRDIKADDIQFGLYAQVALPYDFIINAGLAYGWQQYDLDRRVAIGRTFLNNLPIGFGETLSADYHGNSFQFNLEFAKYFYFDNGLYLRPSVQYDYNRVDIDGYHEHSKNRWNLAGDPMNMIPSIGQSLSDTNFEQHIFRLGGTVGWINECKTFEAAAKIYWVHNGGDTEATGRARFDAVTGLGYNNAFDISGAKYDRNQVLYGLDLKFNPQDYDWSVVVGFEGLSGDKEDSYSGMAGFLYQF